MKTMLMLIAIVFFSAPSAHADLTLTFGGDVNFNKNRQVPQGDGVRVGGQLHSFASLTGGIQPLLDGDLNFANIETVVTDDASLAAQDKTFVFSSHPNSIRRLLDIGFNLFSLANNHSYNRGFGGLDETLNSMGELTREGRTFTYAGIERRRSDFQTARIINVKGHRIAFAAIGISDDAFRATLDRTGILSYRNDSDYALVLKSLRDAQADLKILSIHAGIEMKTTTEPELRARFERALTEGDVDFILGHHPHVVRSVAMVNQKAIFYSLGNYLMVGAADIGGKGGGMDYGLFGRAHFAWDAAAKRLKLQALEAIPLTQMHIHPKPLDARGAADRIAYLNRLSLNDLGGAKAVQFRIRADGSGLMCDDRGLAYTARAQAVCR